MINRVQKLISEYFEMEVGQYVDNYLDILEFANDELVLRLRRKALKHIVEQRKSDNYTQDKVLRLFKDLQINIDRKTYKIVPNTNKQANSLLFVEDREISSQEEGVVIALEIIEIEKNIFFVKTGFYRSISKIKKLLKQK